MNLVKKPALLAIIIIVTVTAIAYIEFQKPDVTSSSTHTKLGENQAPEFVGIHNWINSEPLTMEELRGKVVLIDFWTYSCINCIRTLPYIREWHDKYEDKGLVIVGVHTPEFKFEEKTENVQRAASEEGLTYPIAQDNDYATWRAYKNRFWPRKYLVDIDGQIRYDHIGEGAYEETERVIQELLNERMERLGEEATIDGETVEPEGVIETGQVRTPELYFGHKFARGGFGNEEGYNPGEVVNYVLPEEIEVNKHYVGGAWKNNEDDMQLTSEKGIVLLAYYAKTVNIVAGSEEEATLKIFIDNEEVAPVKVQEEKLYTIYTTEKSGPHLLRIEVDKPGFSIFTFTFG